MSVDAEDALLDALEQRLSRLERFIHGDNPSASSLSKIARFGNDIRYYYGAMSGIISTLVMASPQGRQKSLTDKKTFVCALSRVTPA